MSKRSRDKGKRWQAALAKRWRDNGLFPEAQSTQGSQVAQGEPSDIAGADFIVECKHDKRPQLMGALRQAEAAAEAKDDPRPCVAVCRQHGDAASEAFVVMRLRDWEELVAVAGAALEAES